MAITYIDRSRLTQILTINKIFCMCLMLCVMMVLVPLAPSEHYSLQIKNITLHIIIISCPYFPYWNN